MLKFSQIKALKALDNFSAESIHRALTQAPNLCELDYQPSQLLRDEITSVLNRFHGEDFHYCEDTYCFSMEGAWVSNNARWVCQDELNDSYFMSDRSGDWFHTDERCEVIANSGGDVELWSLSEVRGGTWTCDDCDSMVSDNVDFYSVNGGEGQVCSNCREDYPWCEGCDTYHSGSCSHETCIQSYSTKVEEEKTWGTSIFKGKFLYKGLNELYMGIELEVEAKDEDKLCKLAQTVLDASDQVICCEDGSLKDGFEIKTPPMNLEETKQIFSDILESEAVKGLRSHDGGNCGLHINLSRAGLSQLQQAKILFFFNSTVNRKFLMAICRRFSTDSDLNGRMNYARASGDPRLSQVAEAWSRGYVEPDKPYTAFCNFLKRGKIYSKTGSVNDHRYSAVNFTYNKVEIRLPRGTLKRNTLMANLELAAALTEFTRTGEANAMSGKYAEEFFSWMQLRPRVNKDFPELVEFCVRRKFLPASILPNAKPDIVAYRSCVTNTNVPVVNTIPPYEEVQEVDYESEEVDYVLATEAYSAAREAYFAARRDTAIQYLAA